MLKCFKLLLDATKKSNCVDDLIYHNLTTWTWRFCQGIAWLWQAVWTVPSHQEKPQVLVNCILHSVSGWVSSTQRELAERNGGLPGLSEFQRVILVQLEAVFFCQVGLPGRNHWVMGFYGSTLCCMTICINPCRSQGAQSRMDRDELGPST